MFSAVKVPRAVSFNNTFLLNFTFVILPKITLELCMYNHFIVLKSGLIHTNVFKNSKPQIIIKSTLLTNH